MSETFLSCAFGAEPTYVFIYLLFSDAESISIPKKNRERDLRMVEKAGGQTHVVAFQVKQGNNNPKQ